MSDGIAPFIKEQVNAICALTGERVNELTNEQMECEYYKIKGLGVKGYLRELPILRKKIREYKPDIIHAHYGLSGLLANLATRRVPVVVTYHGSDINEAKAYKYSRIAICLSAWNIFVSQRMMDLVHGYKKKNFSLIPCGVALSEEQLQTREEARKALGWEEHEKKVLFAGFYSDDVKGPDLAKAAIGDLRLKIGDMEMIELRGYTREAVNRLMCGADCLLMASKTEGSPQVIKEAMACGCPIVSTDVGDVEERVVGVEGCYVVKSREPKEVAEAIEKAFKYKGKTKGREKILADGLSNEQIAERIVKIYHGILNV